jgi:hypothetical protein
MSHVMAQTAMVLFVGAYGNEPIQLSGPPRRLAGQVRLRNPQPLSLVLRDAGFSDRSGRLAHMPERHTFAPIVLRPAEERAVPLVIGLDPNTPPGEYRGELNVMGQVRPAVLNVAENVELRVEPKRIVVMSDTARPWRAHIVVTNEGNVSFPINPVPDVDLRDDVANVRDLRGVIAPLLAEMHRNVDDFVAVLLAVLPPQGPVVGRLSVRTQGAPIELAPGRSAKLELEGSLPQELPPNGRYRGRVPVLTKDLEFIVISPAGPPRVEPARPEPAAGGTRRPAKESSGRREKEGGRR